MLIKNIPYSIIKWSIIIILIMLLGSVIFG